MAYIRASQGGSGGGLQNKTSLFANEEPFANQPGGAIQLNQAYTQFDLIEIEFKDYNTYTADIYTVKSVYITPTDLQNSLNQNKNAVLVLGRRGAGAFVGSRVVYAGADTTKINTSVLESNGNSGIILNIYGISL